MDSSFRDWAGLPNDLLDLIGTKLGPLSDFVRYGAVCTQWRDVAFERKQYVNILKESRKRLPMLLITTEADDKNRGLYSVFDRITYNIQLPSGYKNRFIGFSHGWLICLEKNMIISLLNPFTNSCISLPPLKDPQKVYREFAEIFFEYYVHKAMLNADPLKSPNSYAVLIMYGGVHNLGVYKSGNRSWDLNHILPEYDYVLSNIVSYKGYLYGVTHTYKLVQIDIDSGIYKTIIDESRADADSFYLVESQEGDILLVRRIWDPLAYREDGEEEVEDNDIYKTVEFKVFKLEHPISEELGTWVEINNIGEQALCVGDNRSISISTIDFPKCKPNSIYYTDEHYGKYPPYKCQGVNGDLGFYTLEDQSFQPLLDSFECTQPPIWFVPNPE